MQYGNCDKFLIMHPFYSGSHVLTLHHVAEALVNRGHEVSQSIFCFRLSKCPQRDKVLPLFLVKIKKFDLII